MTDKEFIIFLCEQLWDSACNGDEPDLKTIENELMLREINPEDIFVY